MKLRYLTIFCTLFIFITPVLPIETQSVSHIFSAQIAEKSSGFSQPAPRHQKNSGNEDGKNITNALSISPGNTFHKELEAHETIYFCTSWQQNISFDIFSNTPHMLSSLLLSDAGEPLNYQQQIKNNKIAISYHNSSDGKGQYIFIKITNKRDTNQEFQIKLNTTPSDSQKTENPKSTPKPEQTARPKNTPSLSKQTARPGNNSYIPKHTAKPGNNSYIPKHTSKPGNISSIPKHTDKPENNSYTPKHTAKPKNNSYTPKHTARPENNSYIPKHTARPENTSSIPKQITKQTSPPKHTIKPKYTVKPDNPTTNPKQATKPKNTSSILNQTAEPASSYPVNQIPPLEEHFLELEINTSYQLTVNSTNPIIWSSTNPEIVSVEQGKLEVHKSGTAVIYCHYAQTERGSSCFIFSS